MNPVTPLSYVSSTAEAPLLGKTIGQALDGAASRWPDRPALIDPPRRQDRYLVAQSS
jgi:hypothetical protein